MSPRRITSRRRTFANFARPRCEPLEGRIAPALFNVQSPLSFTGLNNNGCVATADLNKDGLMDSVLTNFGTDYASGAGSTITVLYGKAGGGFNKINLNTSGTNVSFVSIADIDGDTFPDVVASNANKQNTGTISVFKNDGAGNLTLFATPFSVFGNNSAWVGLSDVTGDGTLDAIVASFGKDDGAGGLTGNNVTIFQGNVDGQGHGDFTFSGGPITTLAPEVQFVPTALAVADFDGDGLKDIAAAVPGVPPDFGQPYPPGSIYMFKGTGSGGFGAPNTYETGGAFPANIQAAYLNGDTKLDLVVANVGDPNGSPEWKDTSVGVLMNVSSSGSIGFGVTNSLTANAQGTFAVAVADFNLDNKPDIAAVNYGSQSGATAAFISIYTGNGTGTFSPGSPGTYDTQTNFGGGQYLAVGDFDGNSTPDLIVAHASNKVGVLFNTSVPQTSTSTALESSANPALAGASVKFTATVTASSGTASGGTVSFFDGGTQIGSAVNLVNQKAELTTTSLSVGNHTITAVYSGANGFTGSTSNTVNQTINAAVTPQVTINQGPSQSDPTNGSSIVYAVHFDAAVTGFDSSDILFTGSTVTGTLAAAITGASPGQDYSVTVTGMSGTGVVLASVKAGAAINGAGTSNAASTSTDNTVTYDGVAPTVSINQAVGQADPTNVASIKFDVKFGENVTGFDATDVTLAGSTVGGTLSVNVTGSLDTYVVTVTGMTTRGLVIAKVLAGGASDATGNANAASTSTDNSVEFVNNGSIGFKQAVYAATEAGAAQNVTITVTRSGQTDGAVSIKYATSDGTAHSGGSATTGQADYTPATGTLSWADGEGGDKEFTIAILPDVRNEGKELINLTLSDPVGDPGLDLTTATAAIAPNDGQGPGLYLDQDGDKYRIKLNGRTGSMLFYRTDPDGDSRGPIELIELTGTLPNPLKPRASLTIAVGRARTSTDGGTVGLGAVTGPGLAFISARKANLDGDGINFTGSLGSLVIGNIVNGADITTLATTNTRQTTRINALAIGNDTSINVAAPLTSFVAKSFGQGTLVSA